MRKRLIDVSNLRRFGARPENRVAAARLPGARFECKAEASGDAADLYLYGDIAWYDITAGAVAQALGEIKAKTIRVHINSGGGDVWDGVAIYNLLAQRAAKIEVTIDGIAASIASVIAMAGDDIAIARSATMMIHEAWGVVVGSKRDMRATADVLQMIEDDQIIPIYSARTGISPADLCTMMEAETWMNATDCVAKGFANRIIDTSGAKALLRDGLYARVPDHLKNAASWACEAATDLPIDEAESWDGEAARERMLDDAGFNGSSPDSEKARKGFLAYDKSAPTDKGSYKLPFADIRDGKLTAMEGGLRAAASRLPGTDIPDDIKSKARKVLDDYFARRDKEKQDSVLQRMRLRTRSLALSVDC